ncbi:hypothetical protein [Yokenella regensburgei]|uniref:hypothetical protein n=1 Tax=Yokenella regensburgei TaxID=158877 RepID=UPI001375B506|nr:hypothetical protein [Yokenella regensburgei]KAF1366479.1 hypothetical protein FHR25_005061 [Yokenella regensburgei]KAF1366526.1 hypothetical protein FHR25_004989 [Yokenella regensburgei]
MNITPDVISTFIFGLVSSALTYWVKTLHAAIDDLRKDNLQIRERYQLKSDAVRDQEQIMAMLSEIKLSIERINDRIDRRTDATGGR